MFRILFSIIVWIYYILIFLIFFVIIFLVFLVTFPFDKYRKAPNWVLARLGWGLLKASPFWKIELHGIEKFDNTKPTIFIANHQSFLDMALVYHLPWQMKWVSKQSMLYIPVAGWLVWLTGHLTIDRSSKTALRRFQNLVAPLNDLVPVMIFPEGTRTLDGEIQTFKNGAFILAKEFGFTLQPMVLDGSHKVFPSGSKTFSPKGNFKLFILDSLDPKDFENMDTLKSHARELMVKELERIRSSS